MKLKEEISTASVPETCGLKPVLVPVKQVFEANKIGKTKGWELLGLGLIETVYIGRRRYAVVESVETLPERLAAMKGGKA